jgi:hypothetical protein
MMLEYIDGPTLDPGLLDLVGRRWFKFAVVGETGAFVGKEGGIWTTATLPTRG